MSQLAILYPVFVQVALTFLLWGLMARARVSTLRSKQVRPADIALGQPAWPAQVTQLGNSFRNQFELPVLFYLLAVLVVVTRLSDVVLVALAWVFVLIRCMHAYIHTTSNDIRQRGPVYGIGGLILIVMWIWFVLRFLTAAP
jgi:hypothetical protein